MRAIRIGRPDLGEAWRSMLDAEVTSPAAHRGATLGTAPWPDGYAHDRTVRAVGSGEADFERAVAALRSWRTHEGAGIAVHPTGPPEVGGTVVQRIDLGPASVLGCLRVLEVVEEPRRFAVAFGTLPLHVEEGEEAFVATLDDDGTVRVRVLAFSRPSHLLVRLGRPVARVLQHRAHAGYLTGVERAVAQASS